MAELGAHPVRMGRLDPLDHEDLGCLLKKSYCWVVLEYQHLRYARRTYRRPIFTWSRERLSRDHHEATWMNHTEMLEDNNRDLWDKVWSHKSLAWCGMTVAQTSWDTKWIMARNIMVELGSHPVRMGRLDPLDHEDLGCLLKKSYCWVVLEYQHLRYARRTYWRPIFTWSRERLSRDHHEATWMNHTEMLEENDRGLWDKVWSHKSLAWRERTLSWNFWDRLLFAEELCPRFSG